MRKLPWTVKFIIHPNQQNVYDEFCKQLLSSGPPYECLSNTGNVAKLERRSSYELVFPETQLSITPLLTSLTAP